MSTYHPNLDGPAEPYGLSIDGDGNPFSPRATGSASACCYCGGAHNADNCPTTFTPINDCEHKDADDGCCHHPKNMTPECHVGACPRLHRRIYEAWNDA